MRRWLLLCLTALFFSCPSEQPSSPQQQQSDDESKPQDGGTVVRRLRNDVATLNPILADSLEDRYVTYYLFPPLMAFFNDLLVVPEHVYSKGDFKPDYALTAVGTGPYRLVRREAGKEVLIERRPDYWGAQPPHLQRVLFKVISDDATAWNAIK